MLGALDAAFFRNLFTATKKESVDELDIEISFKSARSFRSFTALVFNIST